jgi:hypothetical protein
MHERCVGSQRESRIGHRREFFIGDRDESRAGLSRVAGLGHDDGNFVAGEADAVRAEDRLVMLDQPKGVVGHVGSRQDGDHARRGKRGGRVDLHDPSLGAPRVDNLQVQRVSIKQVAGVARIAGDFGERVMSRQRLSDDAGARHEKSPAEVPS